MNYIIKPIWATNPKRPDFAERTETCVILGGGPSLRTYNMDFWISLCSRVKCFITINDSWRLLLGNTQAVNYFCDAAWWSMQLQKNPRSLNNATSFHDMIYKGDWITGSNDPMFQDHPQVKVVKLTGQRGLELDPSGLRHGSNSGYQAINLAYHLGAKRVVLLGYDMRVDGHRTNWHNEPRLQAAAYNDVIQKSMLPHFPTLIDPLKEARVEVINATPVTLLHCFPKMSLEEAIKPLDKLFQHAIPADEHINDYRARYGLPPYPTKEDVVVAPDPVDVKYEPILQHIDLGTEDPPPPVWEGDMEDWRS